MHGDLPWTLIDSQSRINLFEKHFEKEEICEIPDVNIDKNLTFEARSFLNNCLRIDKNKRWEWKEILESYAKKNDYFKKKEDNFRSIFKNLIEGKDENGNKYEKL